MPHNFQALKNKHQHNYEKLPELYLYEDYKVAKNIPKRLSQEITAELDRNIFYMRLGFRRNAKRLRRNLFYSNWLKNIPESAALREPMKLRSRHA